MILGSLCLLCAIGFLLYNRWEAETAKTVSQSLLDDVKQCITEKQALSPTADSLEETPTHEAIISPEANQEPNAQEMAIVTVGGYDCIGILSIPILDLELPVLSEWSYAKLKKAPCLYYGSCFEKDFVIAAHNYTAHFGKLSKLHPGDLIVFTDAKGETYYYEVVLLETLSKNATEEMITAGFDLSLYTCTLGGGSRITVRCKSK